MPCNGSPIQNLLYVIHTKDHACFMKSYNKRVLISEGRVGVAALDRRSQQDSPLAKTFIIICRGIIKNIINHSNSCLSISTTLNSPQEGGWTDPAARFEACLNSGGQIWRRSVSGEQQMCERSRRTTMRRRTQVQTHGTCSSLFI